MGQNKSIFYESVPQPDVINLPLHMMETSESEEEIYNVEESEEDSKEYFYLEQIFDYYKLVFLNLTEMTSFFFIKLMLCNNFLLCI